jgi:hypothetical protein
MTSARSIECAPEPFCPLDCVPLSSKALTEVARKTLTISAVALIRFIAVVRLIFKVNPALLKYGRAV